MFLLWRSMQPEPLSASGQACYDEVSQTIANTLAQDREWRLPRDGFVTSVPTYGDLILPNQSSADRLALQNAIENPGNPTSQYDGRLPVSLPIYQGNVYEGDRQIGSFYYLCVYAQGRAVVDLTRY